MRIVYSNFNPCGFGADCGSLNLRARFAHARPSECPCRELPYQLGDTRVARVMMSSASDSENVSDRAPWFASRAVVRLSQFLEWIQLTEK